MVKSCCVFKCTNKANAVAKEKRISFFRFPANKRKRAARIRAVNRKDWTPTSHVNICSEHFFNYWHSDDPDDDNYVPTKFSY
ncbi:hypothetical protein KUTeg_012180 [Tegillarca granosa]|uniref:THAP-type domain-containing protein n=1 Tax=Tegillarca granosa TaxID=220873 RepID=A0ABQ9F2C2_TEGGR|nr:hypothetical protein KUTeg_012180 [Tegillarca granosa]